MNIDEMPAGPEMDILLAEKVMGGRNSGAYSFEWENPATGRMEVRPKWSTRIAVAMQIVEHLKFDGWASFSLIRDWNNPDGTSGYYCTIERFADCGCTTWSVEAEAPTAELAICRAALKASESDSLPFTDWPPKQGE